MRLFAVEICDKWTRWHVATTGVGQLCIFAEKSYAIDVLKVWTTEAVKNRMIRCRRLHRRVGRLLSNLG